MIDLHYWPTPNGWKVSILLEECALPYALKPVNIARGEQFDPAFLRISPNNRIPAIVDHAPEDGGEAISLFETGAILIYIAEKAGRFFPGAMRARKTVLEWLMWQMGGLGPMLGQNGHFKLYAPEKIPYAMERYEREAMRLYRVLDTRLADHEYLADELSIADFACLPWVRTHRAQGIALHEFPHVARWYAALRARPSVQRGLEVGKEFQLKSFDQAAMQTLFGVASRGA